jgi:hypothetical protein
MVFLSSVVAKPEPPAFAIGGTLAIPFSALEEDGPLLGVLYDGTGLKGLRHVGYDPPECFRA